MNDGLLRRRFHLLQSVRQSFGITRELDGGGVGEKFALPRNGPFDHAPEKRSVPTDESQEETDDQNHQVHKQTDTGADFRPPSDIAVTLAIGPAHDPITEQRDAKKHMNDSNQPHVQTNVIIETVAIVMGENSIHAN